MTFKKLIRKLHLFLGLTSGLIVVFLGLSGCVLAFEVEIRNLTEDYRFVQHDDRPLLPPSALKIIAEKVLVSKKALGIEYPGEGRAAIASYYDEKEYELVFVNPYTGAVLKHRDMTKDFFRIVVDGHYYLWLPRHIGQPIVASATLVFLVMMITGLILWWPRNRAARKQRFTIKWNAKWRRKNYDLHNVLGFYMTWVAIFLALTGLVFGFQWFAKSVYWVTNGGKAAESGVLLVSDTTKSTPTVNMTDQLWAGYLKSTGKNESLGIYFAAAPTSTITVVVNHRPGTFYNSDFHQHDQFSGQELQAKGSYAGPFSKARMADKIVRMNYDLHVGAVLGLPGKLLVFFASLIASTLPVTGFLIWRGRRKKRATNLLQPKNPL